MEREPARILRYLADVAGSADSPGLARTPKPADLHFIDWSKTEIDFPTRSYPPGPNPLFSTGSPRLDLAQAPRAFHSPEVLFAEAEWKVRGPEVARLAELDELHNAERLLRWGWLFLSGEQTDGSSVWLPLLSAPVKLEEAPGRRRFTMQFLDDPALPDGAFSDESAATLEEGIEGVLGALTSRTVPGTLARHPQVVAWVRQAARALGLDRPLILDPVTEPPPAGPVSTVATGAGLFLARDLTRLDHRTTLMDWATRPLEGTALAEITSGGSGGRRRPEPSPVSSPLPTNERQQLAMGLASAAPVTVISGPPGTGKTHTAAAIAIQAVTEGNSVLMATQSDFACDAIADLLERQPGPRHIRFGRSDRRARVSAELSEGADRPLSRAEYQSARDRLSEAINVHRELRGRLVTLLEEESRFSESLLERQEGWPVTALAPGVLHEGFDIERAISLAETASGTGWLGRRALRKVRKSTEADGAATLADIVAALEVAKLDRLIDRVMVRGGLDGEGLWRRLEEADREQRRAIGAWSEAKRRSPERSNRSSTEAVAILATALRSGRVTRRRLLADIDADGFLAALPLWLGTTKEIEDTLPKRPGLFDLVIFDEASQINLIQAAPALARARRAVVIGDPKQLRHLSFVGDDAMAEDAERGGLTPAESVLFDVRRNSLFDVATAAASTVMLDEHFRSVPHIISFSNERFYGGTLRLMTQHPSSESTDAIEVRHVGGRRNDDGVNHEEIVAAEQAVRVAMAAGRSSIGVVSPFRAQADALEEMLIERFSSEELRRFGVRVGTVHGFQGNEREEIIVSVTLDRATLDRSLRFIEDPHLFNVLVTRARQSMTIVTSVERDDLPEGLLADYLRWSSRPPAPWESDSVPTGWVAELAAELSRYGVRVVPDYPVAGWTVDLAVGEGPGAVGVEARVHADGADAHIRRRMALRRAGWEIVSAFESQWLADPEAAVQRIVRRLVR